MAKYDMSMTLDKPDDGAIQGIFGKVPTKVTGDFSTDRLTRTIHKLFGGTGDPEPVKKDEEIEEA